jgi:hypothetical protein
VVVAGAGDRLQCFAVLIWRDRRLVSLEGTAIELLGGSGWSGAHLGAWPGGLVGTARKYSNRCGPDRTGAHFLGR